MRIKHVVSILFSGLLVLLLNTGVQSQSFLSFSPLSKEQVTEARKIAGPHVKSCGVFYIQREGYSFIGSGIFRLNNCAIASLKQKKPFLLIYKAARKDGFPAWCLIGTTKGQIYTLGFPVHDETWNRLRKLPCNKYKIVTIKGKKFIECE